MNKILNFLFRNKIGQELESMHLFPARGENLLVGYINLKGKFIIKPQYIKARKFDGENAVVRAANGKYGIIDKRGNYIVKPRFDVLSDFFDGDIAKFQINNEIGFVNKQDEIAIKPRVIDNWNDIGSFHEGLAYVRNDLKMFGYINKSGERVIKSNFRVAHDFCEGLACAKGFVGNKYGYIDKTGNWIIKPQFDEADNFREGLAAVGLGVGPCDMRGGYCGCYEYGFIDKNGQFVIKPQFDLAGSFIHGFSKVKKGKWGVINKNGDFVIEPKFDIDGIYIIGNGLFRVRVDNKCGVIDKEGNYVISPQSDIITDIYPGLAYIFQVEGKTKEIYIETTREIIGGIGQNKFVNMEGETFYIEPW